jgi:hypothetical protein
MFEKFLLRTGVGLVAYLIIGSLISGLAAFQFLGVLVICTAGVGLIVVIPACYLIGLMCTIWFIPLGEKDRSPASGTSKTQPPSAGARAQEALEGYILAGLRRGKTPASIREQCLQAGWAENVIRTALESAEHRQKHFY